MNANELIESWPGLADAKAETIFASDAWGVTVSYRGNDATLVKDATRERDVIGIEIAFDDEPHFLALAMSEDYPDLSKVWESRAKLPDEILLALIEKECGALFQTLENAVRRQLSVKGLADPETAKARNVAAQAFAIRDADGEAVCDFSLSADGLVLAEFGQIQNLDVNHACIRELTRLACVEYAAFTLKAADLAGLAPGDRLLLPEIGTEAPRWVTEIPDDDLVHVFGSAETEIDFAAFADDDMPKPPEPTALVLLHDGRRLAEGRLVRLGEQNAMAVEAICN